MASRILKRRWIFVSAATLITTLVITAGVFSARRPRPDQKPQKKVVALPDVISHVPRLRIANITVNNLGAPDAIAVLEILNTSNLAVMFIEISTKNKAGDSGAFSEDGLVDPTNPKVVIPPFGTKTLEMPFTNMVPDAPLVVSAAVFADGTEEGDRWALNLMRVLRKKHQEQLRVEGKNQKEKLQP